MAEQVKEDQAYAYAELLEILDYMEESYVEKIPKKLINVFKENALNEYQRHLDMNLPLKEQEISAKTTALLSMLTIKYWSNSEEKEDIMNVLQENSRKKQEELNKKYNPDNIFNNNKVSTEESEIVSVSESPKENKEEKSVNGLKLEEVTVDESSLPMDYATLPWYKKVFTKVRSFISELFKKVKNPT